MTIIGSIFDFEIWSALARANPEQFERFRATEVQKFLDASSPRQRKLGVALQAEIDHLRRMAGDPNAACASLAHMLSAQLKFLAEGLEGIRDDLLEVVYLNGAAPAA